MSELHAVSTTMDKIVEGEATEQHFTVAFALPRHCLARIQPAGFALAGFDPHEINEDCMKVKLEDCSQNLQEVESFVPANVYL
jgi:hypothetical protein